VKLIRLNIKDPKIVNKKIENTIIKYFSRSASFEELIELTEWLNKKSNNDIFLKYVKTNYLINANMFDSDSETETEKILKQIKIREKHVRNHKLKKLFRYAAMVAIMVGGGYFYLKNDTSSEIVKEIITETKVIIKPGHDRATLTVEDGSIVALEKGNRYQNQNVKSNGEEIIYEVRGQNTSKIAYNYLTIPRGGQFQVTLSDGTRVWLNSESQLKYPVRFIDGKTRNVELVYGEAYFDVSPSEEHEGSKFKVLNQSQEVEVLGTEFNIKAYKDEFTIYTTLVEGKVAVRNGTSKQNLIPNQQTNLNLKNNSYTISTVDVKDEISWKNGIFSFSKKPLKEIMKTIARWYDVNVVFENKQLEEITFSGVLGKNQNIEEILLTLKTLSTIKDYNINDKTIKLK
tara:strand:- start:10745 stop:11947 length:1203 start_codon:yes stop_codon:yes gene_type:complete